LDARRSVASDFGKVRGGGVAGHRGRGSKGGGASANGDDHGGVCIRAGGGADGRCWLHSGGVGRLGNDGADDGLGGVAGNNDRAGGRGAGNNGGGRAGSGARGGTAVGLGDAKLGRVLVLASDIVDDLETVAVGASGGLEVRGRRPGQASTVGDTLGERRTKLDYVGGRSLEEQDRDGVGRGWLPGDGEGLAGRDNLSGGIC